MSEKRKSRLIKSGYKNSESLIKEVAETEYADALAILLELGIPKDGLTLPEFVDLLTSNSMTIHLSKDAVKYIFSSYLNIPLTSSALLDLFITCFNTTPEIPRKARVISCLNRWIDFHWTDFSLDLSKILAQLKDFYSSLEENQNGQWKKFIQAILAKVVEKSSVPATLPAVMQPQFFGTFDPRIVQSFKWQKVAPDELVKQFTFYDEALFSHIKSHDFIFYKPATQSEQRSFLDLFIFHYNRISLWAKESILNEPDLKSRKKVVKKLLDICDGAKEFNNLSLLFAIMAAFQANPIYRLKQTWSEIRQTPQWIAINELTTPERNYKGYRDHIKSLVEEGKSFVPYIGVHLTDLVHIQDGLPNKLPEEKVNFLKHLTVAKTIHDVLKLNTPADIPPKKEILYFIHTLKPETPSTDEDLKKLSQRVEPRLASSAPGSPVQRSSRDDTTFSTVAKTSDGPLTTAQRTKKIIKKATIGFSDSPKTETQNPPKQEKTPSTERVVPPLTPKDTLSTAHQAVSKTIDLVFDQHHEHVSNGIKAISENYMASANSLTKFETLFSSSTLGLKDTIMTSFDLVIGHIERLNSEIHSLKKDLDIDRKEKDHMAVALTSLSKNVETTLDKYNSHVTDSLHHLSESFQTTYATIQKLDKTYSNESLLVKDTLQSSFGLLSTQLDKLSEDLEAVKKKGSTGHKLNSPHVQIVDSTSEEDSANGEALCVAAWAGNLPELTKILALPTARNFVNHVNSREQCALYCAARQNHQECVIELLKFPGLNINLASPGGTALHAASFNGNGEMTGLLLANGANPRLKNKHEMTARQEAKRASIDAWTIFEEKGVTGLLEEYPICNTVKQAQAAAKRPSHGSKAKRASAPLESPHHEVRPTAMKKSSSAETISSAKVELSLPTHSPPLKRPPSTHPFLLPLEEPAPSTPTPPATPVSPREPQPSQMIPKQPMAVPPIEPPNMMEESAATDPAKALRPTNSKVRLERLKFSIVNTPSVPAIVTAREQEGLAEDLDEWINEMLSKSASSDLLFRLSDGLPDDLLDDVVFESLPPFPPPLETIVPAAAVPEPDAIGPVKKFPLVPSLPLSPSGSPPPYHLSPKSESSKARVTRSVSEGRTGTPKRSTSRIRAPQEIISPSSSAENLETMQDSDPPSKDKLSRSTSSVSKSGKIAFPSDL